MRGMAMGQHNLLPLTVLKAAAFTRLLKLR